MYHQIKSPGVLENLTIDIDDFHEFRRYILFIENQWQMNQDFTYTIFINQDEIIGQISLYNIAFSNFRGEIGIWLGKSNWGQGYGKDALQTIIAYGFKELHLNRLQSHIFVNNLRSIRLFEGVGFKQEGIIREYVCKNAEFKDVYSYGLLKRNYF